MNPETTSTKQRIDYLLNTICNNNSYFIDQLTKMNDEDRRYFSIKITDLMERTNKTVSKIKAENPAETGLNDITTNKTQNYGN